MSFKERIDMALQLGATREAFLAAGTPPDKAAAAAEELAAFEGLQSGIEARFAPIGRRLERMDGRLDRMDLRLNHMDWKIDAMLSVIVPMLGGQFLLWTKIGEISGQLSQVLARLH